MHLASLSLSERARFLELQALLCDWLVTAALTFDGSTYLNIVVVVCFVSIVKCRLMLGMHASRRGAILWAGLICCSSVKESGKLRSAPWPILKSQNDPFPVALDGWTWRRLDAIQCWVQLGVLRLTERGTHLSTCLCLVWSHLVECPYLTRQVHPAAAGGNNWHCPNALIKWVVGGIPSVTAELAGLVSSSTMAKGSRVPEPKHDGSQTLTDLQVGYQFSMRPERCERGQSMLRSSHLCRIWLIFCGRPMGHLVVCGVLERFLHAGHQIASSCSRLSRDG